MLAPVSFQTSSESSVAGLTSSKQCHQHVTTRAMGSSKSALNSLGAHLRNVPTPDWDIYMALIQICTTSLGQGLLSLAPLLFNCLVCGIMPIIDRKPINRENDDEHHSKLIHRKHKNGTNNDASPVIASIPIGPTVAVQ